MDVCHEQVVRAERQENGSRQNILLAEVKCFSDEKSHTTDLYIAVGQYLVYRELLDKLSVTTAIYLAIPGTIYDTVFEEVARSLIQRHHIKLIIVNLGIEAIEQWID